MTVILSYDKKQQTELHLNVVSDLKWEMDTIIIYLALVIGVHLVVFLTHNVLECQVYEQYNVASRWRTFIICNICINTMLKNC